MPDTPAETSAKSPLAVVFDRVEQAYVEDKLHVQSPAEYVPQIDRLIEKTRELRVRMKAARENHLHQG